jgi:hypothetical protein
MRKLISIVASALLLAGCIPSLHPLYGPGDLAFAEELLGIWERREDKARWAFTAYAPKSYRLVQTDDKGREGRFDVRLLRLGEKLFLDLYPEDAPGELNEYYRAHLVKAHTFLHVEALGPRLRLRGMNHGWLEKLLEKSPGAIAHERRGNRIVLTAPTGELQAFVLQQLETPEAFGKAMALERVGPR